MMRVTRFLRSDRPGVSGVIVGALLGSGLMLGLVGLVVDGGALYINRGQQQIAAENAVATLINQCVATTSTCATTSSARTFVTAHLSPDSTLVDVCGTGIARSAGGTSCLTTSGLPADCTIPTGIYASSYIRVRTRDSQQTGSLVLDATTGATSDKAALGCAQSSVLVANGANVNVDLPLALPACFVSGDTTEHVLVSIVPSAEGGTNGGSTCTVDTANGPITERSISGFTQTSLTSTGIASYCTSSSTAGIPVNIWLDRMPNEKTDLCGQPMTLAKLTPLIGKTLFFPVVGPPTATGQGNYSFTVRAFRAFTLTGFKLKVGSGGNKTAQFWTANGCPSTSFCVSGYFTNATADVLFPPDPTTIGNTPNLGLTTIVPLF